MHYAYCRISTPKQSMERQVRNILRLYPGAAIYQEVSDLHQRTREGIETARLNGKQIGQPKGTTLITQKSLTAKETILRHSRDFGGTLSDAECILLLHISRNTFYKYKAELKTVG